MFSTNSAITYPSLLRCGRSAGCRTLQPSSCVSGQWRPSLTCSRHQRRSPQRRVRRTSGSSLSFRPRKERARARATEGETSGSLQLRDLLRLRPACVSLARARYARRRQGQEEGREKGREEGQGGASEARSSRPQGGAGAPPLAQPALLSQIRSTQSGGLRAPQLCTGALQLSPDAIRRAA